MVTDEMAELIISICEDYCAGTVDYSQTRNNIKAALSQCDTVAVPRELLESIVRVFTASPQSDWEKEQAATLSALLQEEDNG